MLKYEDNKVVGYILLFLLLVAFFYLGTLVGEKFDRPKVKDYITKTNVIDNEINKENIEEYFDFKKEFVFQKNDFHQSNSKEYFYISADIFQIRVEFKNAKQFKEFKKTNVKNALVTAKFRDGTISKEKRNDELYVNKIIFNYNIEDWETLGNVK